MPTDLSAAAFSFHADFHWTSRTSDFSILGAKKKKIAPLRPALHNYVYAIEDLADLATGEACSYGEIVPSRGAVKYASYVLNEISSAYPPPEVTSRANGTILLLWHDDRGFLSIEIGEHRFGLVSSRRGFPSVRISGDNQELPRQVPRRAPGEITARSDDLSSSGASRDSVLEHLVTTVSFAMSNDRTAAATV